MSPNLETRSESDRLRILVIDRSPPTDLTQGSSLIARHLFSRLGQHDLTLVCPALREPAEAEREALERRFDRIVLVPRKKPVNALGGWLEARLAATPLRLPRALDIAAGAGFRRVLQDLMASSRYDIIHTRGLPMAPFAPSLPRGPALLLEMGDSSALGTRRARGSSLRGRIRAAVAAAIEARTLTEFEVVTTVADADAAEMRRLAPSARIEVVPTGVDADHFHPLSVAEDSATVVFVGAMSYAPNVDAVLLFADQVLPRVRARHPEARFVIVGRDPAPAVQALAARPGIEVTGLVPDIRHYLASAAIVVVPMVSGSGIKNKVMEALAMGRAVVATRLGVEGVAAVRGEHLLVEDDPETLAQAVIRLIEDPAERRRLGEAGRQFIAARYTWEACARRYDQLYRELAERN